MKRFLTHPVLLAIALAVAGKALLPPNSAASIKPSSATGQLAHPEGGAMAAAETSTLKGRSAVPWFADETHSRTDKLTVLTSIRRLDRESTEGIS